MAKIISNVYLGENIYELTIDGQFDGKMGQFYMLRAWNEYPLLSRPISIYDIGENYIKFVYRVVGKGTKILSELKKDDDIKLEGPYGNGFEKLSGKVALVGGGIGIAPLYLTAKEYNADVDVYLGFSTGAFLVEEFKKVSNKCIVAVGENITNYLNPNEYDYILTCGPHAMMKAIYNLSKNTKAKVYVSTENKMACGIGACLVCTCSTKHGNKKVCKDGPVFLAEDVMDFE